MSTRHLSLALRIFFLLAAGVLAIQAVNAALLLGFPPPPEPVFSLAEIRAALNDGVVSDKLRVSTMKASEVKPPDERLTVLRDHLASLLGVPAERLGLEFAKPSAEEAARADKAPFDVGRLMPRDTPHAGRIDLDALTFNGHFKIARQLEDGNWRVVSPADTMRALWLQRAIVWLAGTVVLSIPLAYLLASWLSRPVRRFAIAAERLGRNLREPPMSLDGPPEIDAAAKAFNQMSRRLSQYVDDHVALMAAIAHDLRTPLTRLSFRLDGLSTDLRAKAEADIGEMRNMLAAVLDFVRTLQNDRPRRRQDLRSLITSIADNQVDMGHRVVVEDGPEVVMVGDHQGLHSLFANLIDNAIAYGGAAHIRLSRQDAQVVVDIEDDGPGLADEELERVFEPFYRAEPSRNRDTGGIGLGLALVRSVAISHGGRAWLENRIGHGLRARVELPI